jgi:hypothetical protein
MIPMFRKRNKVSDECHFFQISVNISISPSRQAIDAHSVPLHAVQVEHSVLLSAEHAAVSYVLPLQVVQALHTLSDVAVQGLDSYVS